MMKLKSCLKREEWDNYILENDGHPLQLWGWGELKSSHGWQADHLFLTDENDEIYGAAQVLIRKLPWPFKSLAYIPRGPLVSDENKSDLLNLLTEHIKQTYHSVAITIEPDEQNYDTPQGWILSKNHILPNRTIILDLTQDESSLMGNMAKKTRQYIRKSGKENMVIKSVKSHEELEKCIGFYHETAERAHFNLHDDQYYYDAFDKLGDHAQVFATYVDNQPVAFLWLVISAATSYELYGGMNDIGQQTRANYALKWHAIKKCKEWGLSRYDFGGLLEGGVTTFKMGWTDAETDLVGAFDYPLSASYTLWSKFLPTGKRVTQKLKAIIKRK